MYSIGLTTTIIIVIVVVILAVITTLAVAVSIIIICIKVKTSLKPDHRTFIDAPSNAAYGCVGGGKTSSVPAEYETPTVDVQSNVAYGHVSGGKIPSTAVYETVSTDL